MTLQGVFRENHMTLQGVFREDHMILQGVFREDHMAQLFISIYKAIHATQQAVIIIATFQFDYMLR